jgi:hypothetical protein
MKKVYLQAIIQAISIVILLLLLNGCRQTTVVQPSSEQVDDLSKVKGSEFDDWCRAKSNWGYSSTEEDLDIRWVVKGFVESGEYTGLCHVEYTQKAGEETWKTNYYLDKEGTLKHMEFVDENGQKVRQEINE